jgi:hypothetical protein
VETLCHRVDDVIGSACHVLVRVLEDPTSSVLQLVATLCVDLTLGRRRVPLAPGNLDDDAVRLEQEVDTRVRRVVTAMNHLRPRSRQPTESHQAKEVAFEHRVAAGVDEQLIQ